MEAINKIIEKKDFPMQKSSRQSQVALRSTMQANALIINEKEGCCEISKYNDSPMTAEDSVVVIKKLTTAFPSQSRDFFLLLLERMMANGFTKDRCADAVNHIIDNFAYKQINIADVIKFDKKRKVYTYGQMCAKLICNGGTEKSTDSFRKVEIDGRTYWFLPGENH